MKVLYIDFWSIHEQLTVSTVFPTIKVLEDRPEVDEIILISIERNQDKIQPVELPFRRVKHIPIRSKNLGINLLTKLGDFVNFPKMIRKVAVKEKCDLIVARTASAGALAYLVHEKINIPFIVESFEPHSDYMYESGVWKKSDPRFIFQKKWEKGQKQKADYLVTVSENYKQQLLEVEGVPERKVKVIPCTVSTSNFQFSKDIRKAFREKIGIEDKTVCGIYVGKFGDIYYDAEAFEIFKLALDYFEDFFLIILSPNDANQIRSKLDQVGFPQDKVHVKFAAHKDIPSYLSASDFAFSTIRPAKSRVFCSPVKDGEYWANGLPILLTDRVGDDYKIIPKHNVGAIFNLVQGYETVGQGLEKIALILKEENYRERIMRLCNSIRSDKIIETVYSEIFTELE